MPIKTVNDREYWTPSEVARHYKVSVVDVWADMLDEKFPHMREAGRAWIPRDVLDNYYERRQ